MDNLLPVVFVCLWIIFCLLIFLYKRKKIKVTNYEILQKVFLILKNNQKFLSIYDIIKLSNNKIKEKDARRAIAYLRMRGFIDFKSTKDPFGQKNIGYYKLIIPCKFRTT